MPAEYKPTAADRRRVEVAAAGGMSHDEIAMALAISRPTLYKYFDAELSTGASKRRLQWLEAMDKAARKGNVSAQKALLATMPSTSVPKQDEQPKTVGKKEQAAVDAKTAAEGTGWSDLLPPPTMQ